MYRFVFDNKVTIDVPELKGLKIGLSNYNGHNTPRYMYLWFKKRYVDKSLMQKIENQMYYSKLTTILIYSEFEEDHIDSAIPVPEPFIQAYYEEGDLVITFGEQLYANDAY